MSQMLAGQGKTAPVAEVVQTAPPPAYDQAVTATVVHAAPMSPPMVVTCPPGVAPGQPMRVVDPATGQTMQVTVPNGVKPGGQFQVQFPAPAPVVQAPAQGQVVHVQGQVVHQAVAPASSATRRCRGCGIQFELDAKTNPASAAAFRCKRCRQISFSNFF